MKLPGAKESRDRFSPGLQPEPTALQAIVSGILRHIDGGSIDGGNIYRGNLDGCSINWQQSQLLTIIS